MQCLTFLTLLNLLHLIHCDCVINHQTLLGTWEKQLHKDLRKNFKWYENPNECNVTVVDISFMIKAFEMDSSNNIFSMYSTMMTSWIDKRLTWNQKDYGGIERTVFEDILFWIPNIQLNNRIEEDGFPDFYGQECSVKNNGQVSCNGRILDTAQCTAKMSSWPYDTQECNLDYRIAKEQKDVRLISHKAVHMASTQYGPDFTIVDCYHVSNVSDDVQLRITFVLDRNGHSLAAIIIFPSILLSILTASSIVLDVNDRNRLLMISFSIMCHFFYLIEIGYEIPKHSEDAPTILLFYRLSLIWAMFLLVATVFLEKLRNKESASPRWVSSVYSIVFNSYGKYLIWPRWKTRLDLLTSQEVDIKSVDVWNGFANIVNSVCFFVTVIVYCVMIPILVPRKQPIIHDNKWWFLWRGGLP
ncbi:ligand-gated ion channel 4-like [Ostrinia nubilalis]|uniref:ligand-gated ion channel 4-like n=1 Tax=Ostrinia nubilalis TaxID=29057 RepID=UPI0030823EE6